MATLTGPSDEPNNPGYNLAMLQRSKILPRQRPPKSMGGKARSAKDTAALMRTPESTVLIESAVEEDDIRPVAKRRRLEVPRVESDEQRHELKAAISAPKSNDQVKDDDIRIGEERKTATEAEEQAKLEKDCLAAAIEIFPNICRTYLSTFYAKMKAKRRPSVDTFIGHILRAKKPYPTEPTLKQKRERERSLAEAKPRQSNFENIDYDKSDRASTLLGNMNEWKLILQAEFPLVPADYITGCALRSDHAYQAYNTLAEAERSFSSSLQKPYRPLKKTRTRKIVLENFEDISWPTMSRVTVPKPVIASHSMFLELSAARRKRSEDDAKFRATAEAAHADAESIRQALSNGTMAECKCCFSEYPPGQMTSCNGAPAHLFCLDCAMRNANNEIGRSRYKLTCMDGSECEAGFGREQMRRFLDDKAIEALERMETQEQIQLAGLDGLVHCPFCDFAAICLPVEVDREFRCANADCSTVSCRLCKDETHIPLSCEASKKANKHALRHTVEEAMTDALVRSCNACKHKFIKESGCNKMTCPKCRSVQCYVCSETITMGYAHFDDKHHGGQKGNCPLFYDTEQKHHEDVQRAGAAAMKKIRAENPFLTEAELKVHFSAAVAKDEAERLKGSQQRHLYLHGLDHAAPNQAHHRGPVPGPYQPPGVRAPPVPAPGPIPPYRPRPHVANEAYRPAAVAAYHRPVANAGIVFRGIDHQGDDFNWGRFPSPAAVANERAPPPGPYRPAEHAVPEQRRVADFVLPEQLQNAVAPAEPWFPFLLGIGR